MSRPVRIEFPGATYYVTARDVTERKEAEARQRLLLEAERETRAAVHLFRHGGSAPAELAALQQGRVPGSWLRSCPVPVCI